MLSSTLDIYRSTLRADMLFQVIPFVSPEIILEHSYNNIGYLLLIF